GAQDTGAAARRIGGDAHGDRGALGGDREQGPARPDHEAARVVEGGRPPVVARRRARAVRPEAASVIRLATRGSPLALAQARAVAEPLVAGGARVEILAMRTEGDRRADARLATVGGKGLFVREIEDALLRGDADVAVHSLKDLPADLPPGLTLAVFPEREDA